MVGSSFEAADRLIYVDSSFEEGQPAARPHACLEMQNIIEKKYLCLEY